MLRMLDFNDFDTVKKLSVGSILGTRICCYAQCYGFDKSFVDFWAGDGVLVARFENAFTIKADANADFDEIREFIDVIGAEEIVTDEKTATAISFTETHIKSGYRFIGDGLVCKEVSVLDEDYISELYDIISCNVN